jgi:hypothetical protein
MEGSDKERLPDHSPTLILDYNVADKYITKENARDDEQGDSSPERQRHRLLQGV